MKRLLTLIILALLIVTGAVAIRSLTAKAGPVEVAVGTDPVPPTPWNR
jgi:hypothetical protein